MGSTVEYLLSHRTSPPEVGVPRLRDDFGATDPPPPAPDDWVQTVRDLAAESVRVLDRARYTTRGIDNAAAWSEIGVVSVYLQQLQDALPKGPTDPEPPPEPPPEGEDWANLLSGAAGLAGRQKWLAGSTGIDLFVRRGTVVRAPYAATVTFRRVPGGPQPIGEMVLVYADGRAVRFRHVAALRARGTVARGEPVATVDDPSMDLLRWPAGYPLPPDGYQHLDLSLATTVARLNPQGGAGGDVQAYRHLWEVAGGIPHIQIIPRTPGPAEGMRHLSAVEQAVWRQWMGPTAAAWTGWRPPYAG